MATGIPVIGLFSGAGGLEAGASLAGADVRLCVEIDPIACGTLRANAQHVRANVLEADVTHLDGRKLRREAGLTRTQPCIVIGGPPCQPFSKAAYWTDPGDDSRYRRARARGDALPEKPAPITEAREDKRRDLVQEFWRLVTEVKAEAFLFENVPSIAHPRSKRILDDLIESAIDAGYGTSLLHVNAVEYGVPQCRRRIVLLGLRHGKPTAPLATHSVEPVPGLLTLPALTAGEALRPYRAKRYAEPEEVVTGRWANQLREVAPGKKLQGSHRLGRLSRASV